MTSLLNDETYTYGFFVTFKGTFEQAVASVTEALAREGFGILTEIDVTKTLREKLGVEWRAYTILGACNPELAHRALEVDPDIGLLLPCNVVVREEDDTSITVAFMDPKAVLALVKKAEIERLAQEVRTRLERVRDALRRREDI